MTWWAIGIAGALAVAGVGALVNRWWLALFALLPAATLLALEMTVGCGNLDEGERCDGSIGFALAALLAPVGGLLLLGTGLRRLYGRVRRPVDPAT